MKILDTFKSFTKFELCLWITSVIVVALSSVASLVLGNASVLSLIASLIGVTSLILIAKGNVYGQVLTIIFSILYSIISFTFAYYGEMITYAGMTLPSAAVAVYTWIKNPYEKGKNEVKVSGMSPLKIAALTLLTIAVTALFYFILKALDTQNLIFSTISVTTSFAASSLLILRSPYYAIAYAANDIVLITLWILACINDVSYLPMIFCFAMFLFNDIYGFVSWRRMSKRQSHKK